MFKPHIYSNMQLDIISHILSRNGLLLLKAQNKSQPACFAVQCLSSGNV